MIFIVLLEIVVAMFICWAIWHEPKLIRFERALIQAIAWEIYERCVEPKLEVINRENG